MNSDTDIELLDQLFDIVHSRRVWFRSDRSDTHLLTESERFPVFRLILAQSSNAKRDGANIIFRQLGFDSEDILIG